MSCTATNNHHSSVPCSAVPPSTPWCIRVVHSNTVERDASTSESARLQRSYRARSTHQLSTPQCARDSTRAPGGLHRPCTVLPCLQLLAASVSRCRCMEAVCRPQSARPQAAEAVLDAPQRVGPGPTRWRRVRCVRADNSADTRRYARSCLPQPRVLPAARARRPCRPLLARKPTGFAPAPPHVP